MHNFLLKVRSLYYLYTYVKGCSFLFKSWRNEAAKDFRKGEFWWKTYYKFYGFPFLLGKNSFTRKPFKIKTVNRKYVHIIYFWPIKAHDLYGFEKNHKALYSFACGDHFGLFCTIFPFLRFIFPVTDFMNLILSGMS